MDKLKVLKAAVFIMTFLIIFGLIVLSNRLSNKGKAAAVTIPENINLSEPEGSRIENIQSSKNQLQLLIKGGNKPDRVIIFNTDDYKKISTITIN